MKRPTIALIVTTYNNIPYLRMVLDSVLRQTLMPTEIIVADDGSGPETAEVVASYAAKSPVPLKHVWQEDLGFRAGGIRNKAIAISTAEYVVMIDGDMILNEHFIADHAAFARRDRFVIGGRKILSKELTKELIETGNLNLLPKLYRNLLLTPLLLKLRAGNGTYARSCNMACWRKDLIAVNGFNEDMTGWGREDSELSWRLINAGVKKRTLKFAGLQYHLYHKERARSRDDINYRIMEQTRDAGITRIPHGIVNDQD